jgi:hypothetical protein
MEIFFACAHFCPTYGEVFFFYLGPSCLSSRSTSALKAYCAYGEVTLQCQNFTFMSGSDDGELRGQNCEIWYAYILLSITLYSVYWHPSVMCVLVLTAFWCWLLHCLPCLHILPFVGVCIHWISCVHIADCCTYLVFLVTFTHYLLTCVSMYLAHLLVLLWI